MPCALCDFIGEVSRPPAPTDNRMRGPFSGFFASGQLGPGLPATVAGYMRLDGVAPMLVSAEGDANGVRAAWEHFEGAVAAGLLARSKPGRPTASGRNADPDREKRIAHAEKFIADRIANGERMPIYKEVRAEVKREFKGAGLQNQEIRDARKRSGARQK